MRLLATATALAALLVAARAQQSGYHQQRFEAAVREAQESVARVLGAERKPLLPASVDHAYMDKFALVEAQVGTAAALHLQSLQEAGVSAGVLRTLAGWAGAGAAVTLRFSSETQCAFDREDTRQVESSKVKTETATTFGALGLGLASTTHTSIVSTVTDYFWVFEANWTLTAFRGTGRGAGDARTLARRSSRQSLKTAVLSSPYPSRSAPVPADLSLTWLLQQVLLPAEVSGAPQTLFRVNRSLASCHTPRRNADVEAALRFGASAAQWGDAVSSFLRSIARVQVGGELLGAEGANAAGLFSPIALFEAPLPSLDADANVSGNVALDPDGGSFAGGSPRLHGEPATASPLINVSAANLLLGEASAGLRARCRALEAGRAAASSDRLMSAREACVLAALDFASRAWAHAADAVEYVEGMLRDQLVAAVGRVLTPADFAGYMAHHNRRLFRPAYQPLPFSYAVRRAADRSPEGTLRIDDALTGQPAVTIHAAAANGGDATAAAVGASPPLMHFALNAETRVAFGGERHLHAWLSHRFSGQATAGLSLTASARQFSSFIVLVGRITGPASFEPVCGSIVKDRDELTIPLALSQLPAPKEFRDAIGSLSPEQQRFAVALRGLQLESSLFGVLVLHIKPQLEAVLNLPPDALTKETALTRALMDLFIQYQVRLPSAAAAAAAVYVLPHHCCHLCHLSIPSPVRAHAFDSADPIRPAVLLRKRQR